MAARSPFAKATTPARLIGSMLPVYLNQASDAKLPGEWKLKLTLEGWLQPWTRSAGDRRRGANAAWTAPRPLQVLNAVGGTKPGAMVLARVTDS